MSEAIIFLTERDAAPNLRTGCTRSASRSGTVSAVAVDEYNRVETIGLLIVEWSRLEESFPSGPGGQGSVDLSAASLATGVSMKQLDRARRVRNAAAHEGSRCTLNELDEALGILELVWRSREHRDQREQTAPVRRILAHTSTGGAEPPTTFPNPKGDNPWDNDAVRWLLLKPDVAAAFKFVPLFECLRCQPARVANQPHRVEEAAHFARRHGVLQRQEFDGRLGKRIVRLYRTDPDRPRYPGNPPAEAGS